MNRQVKTEEGATLAKKLGASFIETSAKDNKHISESNTLPNSVTSFPHC